MARNIKKVIDQIVEVAPDLKDKFTDLLDSVNYTAPELMPMRWGQAGEILTMYAGDHPKKEEIIKIFNDL